MTPAHSEPVAELVALEAVAYVNRYGGRCRDCADEGGVCPRSGIVCTDPGKAIRFVLAAIRYGVENGYLSASAVFTDPTIATLTAERDAALSLASKERAKALEEAAKVVEAYSGHFDDEEWWDGYRAALKDAAATLRVIASKASGRAPRPGENEQEETV